MNASIIKNSLAILFRALNAAARFHTQQPVEQLLVDSWPFSDQKGRSRRGLFRNYKEPRMDRPMNMVLVDLYQSGSVVGKRPPDSFDGHGNWPQRSKRAMEGNSSPTNQQQELASVWGLFCFSVSANA